jgi:hypothetical protein
MNKLVLGSLLGLLAFGSAPAQAQFYPPVTAPYVRPPLFPSIGPPGALSPFGYPYGMTPYGTTPYGMSPYGTMPYGTSPYNTVPYGVGPFGAVPGATGIPPTAAGLNDPNVTGHPTRFFNYSRYFFNQGGAANVPLPGTRPILGANPTPTIAPVIGVAPPRGRANTRTGTGK